MYYLKLLALNNNRIVELNTTRKDLDKRYNLNSCINKGKKELKQAHKNNSSIVGYSIYRYTTTADDKEYTYLLPGINNV